MDVERFTALIAEVTASIQGLPVDKALEAKLNREFPPDGERFRAIASACQAAVAAGWMCKYEAGGLRYGRVIKPGAATHGFSVDVVEMADCKGPHHRHPNGEIDMVMPLEGEARFDAAPRGWLVYPADSAHFPTVSGGRAHVLYLLPEGAIEFTKLS
jgi:hypothetical protein